VDFAFYLSSSIFVVASRNKIKIDEANRILRQIKRKTCHLMFLKIKSLLD